MTLILRHIAQSLILTALLMPIAREEANAQSTLPGFTVRENLPDADVTVKQVTYGNGIFLACLIYPVRLYTSHDGINWMRIDGPPLGQDTNISNYEQQASVTFGAGRFVLTSDSGRIFSTTDFSTWTASASGTTHNIATVQYLNGNFYAVGQAGTFLSSPDGLTWTTRTIGVPNPGYDYQEVLYGNGHLVITAVTPQVVYDSSGAGWTADSSRTWNEHGFARGRFYEFASNMVSTDMHHWSPMSVASDAGGGFAVFEDSTQVYLLSGAYDNINGSQVYDGRISSSNDGINFGPIDTQRVAGSGAGAYFNHRYFIWPGDAHAPLTGSADGVHWYTQGNTRGFLATDGHTDVRMILTGNIDILYTSTDLTTWVPQDTLTGVASLFYDGTLFWAVGSETFTSPDGISWTDKGPSAHNFNGMTYGNATYFAWGPGDMNGNDTLWYSSDGASWLQSATPQGPAFPRAPPSTEPYGPVQRVRILNGNYFVFGTSAILYSKDPGNFNFTTLGQSAYDVAYDADSNRFYFLGFGSDTAGNTEIVTQSMTDPATEAGLETVSGSLSGPATGHSIPALNGFAYSHGHFVTTFDDDSFNPYPYTYVLSSSDQTHWESQWLDRETVITSSLAQNDTLAMEGAHAFEFLQNFGPGTPLPVTLLNFQAVAQDNTRTLLTWQTATQQNSSHFVVTRSVDENTWDSIGTVPAAGNSEALLNYSFTDDHPVVGENDYRLALVNRDNSRQYSPIREVTIGGSGFIVIYPNPAARQLTIQRTVDDGEGAVTLYDARGQVVLQGMLTGTSMTLPLSPLAPGVYQLVIRDANGAVYHREVLH